MVFKPIIAIGWLITRTNAQLAVTLLAYEAADCSGPAAQRLYAERYPMRRTPGHNFFARLHRRLAETGSFPRSAMNRERSARTPDIEENVLHQVQETPSLSTRSVAYASGSIVWRILRENEMHPYNVQLVQTLQPVDYGPRIALAQWYLEKCATDPIFPAKVFFTDEASFTRKGIFNTHNALSERWRTLMQHDLVQLRVGFRLMFGPALWGIASSDLTCWLFV
ncbi:hypothetical protein AVEN_161733-1 [Araneus ventricosus]|uniref:DUF4817 domain-containing protein n=1 Tax=Araneus ventricosus TaxID=182803 RepID=A0A4Y2KJR2_ARAVE|nr:hypothetical protein AVEN_161733-1 [Araneus ventricosus]